MLVWTVLIEEAADAGVVAMTRAAQTVSVAAQRGDERNRFIAHQLRS